jgi:hypothetical protein
MRVRFTWKYLRINGITDVDGHFGEGADVFQGERDGEEDVQTRFVGSGVEEMGNASWDGNVVWMSRDSSVVKREDLSWLLG